MAEIRLDDMAGPLLENWAELMAPDQSFPSGNRNLDRLAHFQERLERFRAGQALRKSRGKTLARLDVLNRRRRVGPTMKIDHDINVVADRFAQLLHQGGEPLDFSDSFQGLRIGNKPTFIAL